MKDRKTLIDITLGSDNMPDIIMVKKNGVKTRFIPDLGQPDPYAHLREAQKRGETIQACNGPDGDWYDLPKYGLIWDNLELGEAPQPFFDVNPDRYRIKPKTKTLYLWAYLDEKTKSWKNTDVYHQTVVSARADIIWAVEFKRLDYTAIEVES